MIFNSVFRGIRKRTFVKVHEELQFMNWCLTCSFLSWHSLQAKKLLWLLLGQLPAIRNVLRNLPTSENLLEKYTIDACPQEPTASGPIQGPPNTWALVKADIVHHIQLIDLNWIESRALSFSNMWHGGWYGFLNRISPILRNRTIVEKSWIGFRRFAVTGRPWWLPAVAMGRFMGRGGRHCIGVERYTRGFTWRMTSKKKMTSLCMLVTISFMVVSWLKQSRDEWVQPGRHA